MVRLSILLTTVLATAAADAAPLVSATWAQGLPGVAITVTNSGSTCTSTGANIVQQSITCPTSSGLSPTGSWAPSSFSVSLTMPSFGVRQFTTGGAIDLFTRATLEGGSVGIQGNAGGVAATRGVPGVVTVKVARHDTKGIGASMLTAGLTTLAKVPFSIGKAGTFTGYFYLRNQLHYLTLDFYAWTLGTRTFTGLTSNFVSRPDLVAMGSSRRAPWDYRLPPSRFPRSQDVQLTWGTGAAVTLVAPSRISIDGPFAQRRTASFSSLSLNFPGDPCCIIHGTPEPPTLLLLGAGFAGLLLTRHRAR